MADWKKAKAELKRAGIAVNTSVPSCELGCACVAGWEQPQDKPSLWQTGKRFSSRYGGYLNHHNLTPELAVKVLTILNDNEVAWKWSGQSHNTIRIILEEAN